jgi:hypothetical protein
VKNERTVLPTPENVNELRARKDIGLNSKQKRAAARPHARGSNCLKTKLGESVHLFCFMEIVAAVALNLATDFTSWPSRAVTVYISGAIANRADQFIKFAGTNTAFICQVSNIRRHDSA